MTISHTPYTAGKYNLSSPAFGIDKTTLKKKSPSAYRASDKDMELYGDKVLAILKSRIGRANAITARAIATELKLYGEYDDRKIRMIIQRIIDEEQETIGSSDRGDPSGYWYIADEDELLNCIEDIDRDIAGYRRRRDNLSQGGRKRFGAPVEQYRMGL